MRLFLIPVIAAAGCASGGSAVGQDASQEQPIDAKVIDAPVQHPDSFVPVDAAVDAFIPLPDASIDGPPPDAACVPMTTQLLANPTFDLTPMGTSWVQTPIDAGYPLITDQDGPAEQSAPYKVWLGGFEAPAGGTVTDVMYQDVTIPANTTQLTLSGYVIVGTMETTTTSVYDTGSLALTQTNGTPIATVASYSNLTTVAAWTAFNYTFTQNLSGQTVRLRMTSSNDDSYVTNIFFDSFALNATHCP